MTDTGTVTIALAGDVMTGRGVDQVLGHPGDPTLHEQWMQSAEGYVALAEQRHGALPRRVEPTYVWGDVLEPLREATARLVNLETAITSSGEPWPDKGIHYRMHPSNVSVLTAAGIDCAVLANNHILDWGRAGLEETLFTLHIAGITTAGVGRNAAEAWAPATVGMDRDSRVVVIAVGTTSSGIPPEWAAAESSPGVALADPLDDRSVRAVATAIADAIRPNDVVVASIHWGGNWGYRVPAAHRRFARTLVTEAGVHIVHGHSSHHPIGLEIHEGRLILYGCGDLINDYEGILGQEEFRPHLGALYLADIDPSSGALIDLSMLPTRMRRFRLERASVGEAQWLADTLDRESRLHGAGIATVGGMLQARW